jgi:signal peptidase II
LFFIGAALVVVLDQLSKLWVSINSAQITPGIELLPGFLDLVYVENTGAVFGLFSNQTVPLIALGIAGSLIVLLFVLHFPPVAHLGTVSTAFILGGQVGNLIDRIRLGHVVDFIDIHFRELFSWPAFNVADAAITVGIFALIYFFHKWGMFSKEYEESSQPQN